MLNREWNERRCWLENTIDFSILFRLRRRRPCRRKADLSFINEVKYEANRIRALDTIILYPTTEGEKRQPENSLNVKAPFRCVDAGSCGDYIQLNLVSHWIIDTITTYTHRKLFFFTVLVYLQSCRRVCSSFRSLFLLVSSPLLSVLVLRNYQRSLMGVSFIHIASHNDIIVIFDVSKSKCDDKWVKKMRKWKAFCHFDIVSCWCHRIHSNSKHH